MSQYPNLFHSTRVPRHDEDELVISNSRARHVMVQHGHAFYEVDVLDELGNALSAESIQVSLNRIIREHEKNEEDLPVGVLTTLPRDEWASVREGLLKNNANTLRSIDESLFAVCLSDQSPDGNIEKEARCMLHGMLRSLSLSLSLSLTKSNTNSAFNRICPRSLV